MPELQLLNTRAVRDEENPAGYCLNCIKKHSAMAHGLFVEIEQRAMQGAPFTDKKIREKMSQAFEQMVHIEDHTIVKMPIDTQTRMILSDISSKANRIRAKLKEGEWALDVKEHVPKGTIDDITEMRLLTKQLQKTNDNAIIDFGCGDCVIENPRITNTGIPNARKPKPVRFNAITGNKLNNSDENTKSNNGGIMTNITDTTQKIGSTIGGTVDKGVSMVTEPIGSRLIGLDRSTVSEILNPQILASLSEGWIFDLIFSPGFAMLGQLITGLGMMTLGPRFLTGSERGKREIVHYGAALAGALLRTSPGEWSAMWSELGATSRLALSDPRRAALAPFRTPDQIRSEVERRTNLSGFGLGSFGLGIPRALQTTLDTDEVVVNLPGKPARFKIA